MGFDTTHARIKGSGDEHKAQVVVSANGGGHGIQSAVGSEVSLALRSHDTTSEVRIVGRAFVVVCPELDNFDTDTEDFGGKGQPELGRLD